MSEVGKTSVYLAVAVVLAGVAYVARPRVETAQLGPQVNKSLFPELQDTGKLTGLKIVRYDEELGETHRFEVAKNSRTGLWTIPSHADYPADAEERVRNAATIFVELNVLGVVTDDASEHLLFGVVEPDEDKVKAGAKGVGLLVRFEGEQGKNYSLVIGKKIKGAEDHRFVRILGQDRVYDVKIDPEKLSTKFEDWIKKDLLELNTWDVENLRVKDYSIVQAVQGTFLEPRFEVGVSWNATDNKWNLDEFLSYKGKEKVPAKLLDNEELNKQKLDDLKTAVDDLSIVDVRRKPKGLGANLKAGSDFMNDMESRDSLRSRGFYLNPAENNQYEVLAANGEVHVSLKDGVQYVLRFGNVAEAAESAKDGKLNRYLLVTAKLDESKLQVPVPPAGLDPAKAAEVKAAAEKAAAEKAKAAAEKPATEKPATEAPAAAKPSEGNASAEKPAAAPEPTKPAVPAKTEGSAMANEALVPVALTAEEAPAAPATPAPTENPAAPAAPPAIPESTPATPAAEKPAEPAAKPAAEPAKPAEPPKPSAEAAKPAEPAKPSADPAKPAPAKAEDAAKPAAPAVDIEQLAKDYQRQLDEWNDKKKKADNKVRELNSRFADWYYVISEDVYKKIHLGRSDLVKESEKAKEEGFGVDSLRDLEKRGVENKKDEAPADSTASPPPLMPNP